MGQFRTMDMVYIYAALIGYFLGSIPFGLLIARLGGQGDIRNIGSGNIGTTNVLRTGRKDLAALTLLFDGGKAAAAFFIANHFLGFHPDLVAAGLALIGHCFPIWLKFKGGKGVATFLGALLAAHWPIGLMAIGLWIATAVLFKMSSLAALVAAGVTPIIAYFMGHKAVAVLGAVLALVIYIRHKDNIGRLLKGEEPKIGKGK